MMSSMKLWVAALAGTVGVWFAKATVPMPAGYTQLDWIESTGTQYVDTGVKGNPSTKLEMDFTYVRMNPASDGMEGLFGSCTWNAATTYPNMNFYLCTSGGKLCWSLETGPKHNVVEVSPSHTMLAGQRYFIALDAATKELKVSTVDVAGQKTEIVDNTWATVPTKETNANLLLLGASYTDRSGLYPIDSINRCLCARLYSATITEDGVPLRDFVPCRNAEDEVGLWDTVNGKFYGNASGTGHFVGPDDVDVRLSYIESTGTQYVDTGVKGNPSTKLEMDFTYVKMNPASDGMEGLFGSCTWRAATTYPNMNFYLCTSGGKLMWSLATGDKHNVVEVSPSHTMTSGQRYFIALDAAAKGLKVSTVDAAGQKTEIVDNTWAAAPTKETNANLLLLGASYTDSSGLHPIDSLNRCLCARLYSATITEGGVPVRSFVPARRADGTVGLFDLENGSAFYGNNGTGDFSWGGVAYNVDGTTLKLHEGTLASSDLAGCTAVEKVGRHALEAGAVTVYSMPLTLSTGVFSLADGTAKSVAVGGTLTLRGGATLKIDVVGTDCDTISASSVAFEGATAEKPFIIDVAAKDVDWSSGMTVIPSGVTCSPECVRVVQNGPEALSAKIENGALVVFCEDPMATWTGAADDGDVTNPQNWEGGAVPGADTIVHVTGNLKVNIPADSEFSAKAVILNGTLSEDCDWSGLAAPVFGKIDLKGHNLTVADLPSNSNAEITDSNGSGYALLDYIESTGVQYINTGVKGNPSTKLEMDFTYVKMNPASDGMEGLFGSCTWRAATTYPNMNFYLCTSGGKLMWSLATGDKHNVVEVSPSHTMTSGQRYFIALDAAAKGLKVSTVDAAGQKTEIVDNTWAAAPTKETNANLLLLGASYTDSSGLHPIDSLNRCLCARLYSATITEGGVPVRSFVPARRISDGKVGLLDLANPGVNEFEFYENENQNAGVGFTSGTATNILHVGAVAGELHVDVAEGKTVEIAGNVSLTGSLKLVKDGEGVLAVSKGQPFIGGTEVKKGTLQYAASEFAFGLPGAGCTVRFGATLDFNGYGLHDKNPIVLDGGAILNSAEKGQEGCGWFGRVTLMADSVVRGHGFGFVGDGFAENILEMNGHALTIDIDKSGEYFYMANLLVTGGGEITVDGVEGCYLITGGNEGNEGKYVHAPTTRLRVVNASIYGRQRANDYTDVTFLDYVSEYTGNADKDSTRWISVPGSFRPGVKWHSTCLTAGAMLDLSDQTGAWEPPCSFSGSTGQVRWPEGECIIDLGDRMVLGDHGKIISWTTAPENVTFRLKPGTLGILEWKDDGLYVKRGLTIIVR